MLLVGLSTSGAGLAVAPKDAFCGQTITRDLHLDDDLRCPGNGLTVGADGVQIDLMGHSITGPGPASRNAGILIVGRTNVTISHGTIAQFRTGIFILNSNGVVVKDLAVVDSGAGVLSSTSDGIRVLFSRDVVLKHNEISGSGDDGIELRRATDVIVKGNVLEGNRAGVRFADGLSSGITIQHNEIVENHCGVKGPTAGNVLTHNSFEGNGQDFCA